MTKAVAKVERLNEKLDSFKYSMTKAEQGRKAALATKRQADFERAYGVAIGDLPQEKMSKLLKAHQCVAAQHLSCTAHA